MFDLFIFLICFIINNIIIKKMEIDELEEDEEEDESEEEEDDGIIDRCPLFAPVFVKKLILD